MRKLEDKNVLVTGGAGFIGSHLVDRLIEENPNNIVVIDDLSLGNLANLEYAIKEFPEIRIEVQDSSQYYIMKQIIANQNIDVIFDLAVVPLPASLIYPKETVDINVSIVNCLSSLLKEGYYDTLVHFSTSESYGTANYVPMDEKHPINPETPYAASKVAGDYIVKSYANTFGLDTSIIRPFNNYGPRQNKGNYAGIIPIVINSALRNMDIIIYGDGKQTRDFIYVKDTADAAIKIYKCEETKNEIINIASGVEIDMNTLVERILNLMKSNTRVLHRDPRPGDVMRHCADVSLANKLIGFEPKPMSDENLLETIDWYKFNR